MNQNTLTILERKLI